MHHPYSGVDLPGCRYYGVQVATALIPFLYANRPGVSMPKILPFFERMRNEAREQGLQLGVGGYCWGGKPATCLAHTELVDCAYVAHPSNLAIPDEIEKVRVPFSIAIGDADFVMGVKDVEKAKAILDAKKDLKSEVIVYPGAKHGFAVRGDPGDEKEKAQGIEAEDQAVNWFSAHLTAA